MTSIICDAKDCKFIGANNICKLEDMEYVTDVGCTDYRPVGEDS